MIAKFDNLDVHEQLSASVNISKALTASIDHQAKQRALGHHILRRQTHKICDLCFQEALEGIIGSTNDAQELKGSRSACLNLSVAEVIVREDLWFLFKEGRRSLVERNIGEDE